MLVNLNDVLPRAAAQGYAVGLFNTIDTDMLQAVLDVAEEMRSPVIIGTAEVLLPYGELKLIAPSLIAAAERASVPVVVHYDHGLTFERCLEALKLGFTSVMYDGSSKPYVENTVQTREIVRIAHAMGATVEGEIGHVGNTLDDVTGERYTTVYEACDYLANTGIDALAVAIGTAHGQYKQAPKLSFTRLLELRAAVSVPLVLHGGSGLTDADFHQSIACGVAKVNIFTDLCLAGMRALRTSIEKNDDYLTTRNSKREAISATVSEKITLFGSAGKA